MAKRQMLPPAADTQKRETPVNLRFSSEDFDRLKRLADFRHTTVSNLLFYVTVNSMLPMMEKEMNGEVAEIERQKTPPAQPTRLPNVTSPDQLRKEQEQ